MSGRLFSAATWYEASAQPAPPHPVLAGDIACDVAVLGGGYTGLMAALSLAERGYDVVVAEAGQIGGGASGRNGGQIVTGYNPSMATLAGLTGAADAQDLWAMALEAKRLVADTVARHGISCGLSWGYLFVAPNRRGHAELAAMAEQWSGRHGYDALRAIDAPELGEMVGSKRYLGGLHDAGGGHLHPLDYVRGIAGAALRAGVRIFESTQIQRVETGSPCALVAAQGTIRAQFLVLAGGAATGRLVPAAAGTVAPVGTYIVATEPLPRARLRAVLRDDVAVCDTNFALSYYRRTPDGRLLFGARASVAGFEPPGLRAEMRAALLHVFPQLADIRLDYLWGGQIDRTRNRLPHFGRAGDTAYFAQGFSGQGVALAGLAGKLIAEAIAGQAERFDVFARIPHRPFPPRPLLTPTLVLASLWYRLRDLL
jgi:gamma-glutamylputrescine oxidase